MYVRANPFHVILQLMNELERMTEGGLRDRAKSHWLDLAPKIVEPAKVENLSSAMVGALERIQGLEGMCLHVCLCLSVWVCPFALLWNGITASLHPHQPNGTSLKCLRQRLWNLPLSNVHVHSFTY